MEILLTIGALHSVYAELMDLMESKRTRGSYLAYFSSVGHNFSTSDGQLEWLKGLTTAAQAELIRWTIPF